MTIQPTGRETVIPTLTNKISNLGDGTEPFDTPVINPAGEEVHSTGGPRLRHVPNAVSAMVLFGARLIAAVLQLRFVDKAWGGGYTGLNALSNQVLLYVTLLELGLAQAAITLLYKPIMQGDFPRIAAIVTALRHDVRRLAAVGAVVAIPCVLLYARAIHGALPFRTVALTLLCVAASGLVQLAAIHFQVYLNAAEQLDKVNYTFAAGYLLKTGVGLTLALATHEYAFLPASIAVLTLAEFASLRIAFRRDFPHPLAGANWREGVRDVRGKAKYVTIQRVAGVAYYQSDFVILSLTTSLVTVKDYAKYQYVAAALLSVVGMVAASLTTSVARMQLRQHAENRRRRYVIAQSAICFVGAVLMVGFWFSAPQVVRLAFGTDPVVDPLAIRLFGVALFLNIVKTVDDVFLIAKGVFEIGWWIPLLEVPIYVVTGVVLSRHIGFLGILVASIATNLAIATLVKGLVLPGPVFDSTRAQWYGSRVWSTVKALVLVVPLAALYGLITHFVHQNLLRVVSTSLLALGYLLVGVRFTFWYSSSQKQQ